ncbi:hypothetical protein BH24ACT11_BH24ACT11_11400 [soil metagenome]
MKRSRCLTAVSFVVAGILALPGCSSPPPDTDPEPAWLGDDLAVTIRQQRVDATTRTVGVELENASGQTLHASAIRLTGGGIDTDEKPLDTDLRPGLTVAFHTSYGTPDCDNRDDPVITQLAIDGRGVSIRVGRRGQVEMRRLLDTECAELRLAEQVSLRLSGPYRPVTVDNQPHLAARLVRARTACTWTCDLLTRQPR